MSKHLYKLYKHTQRCKEWVASRFTNMGRLFLFILGIAFLFGINVQRTMIYQILSIASVLLIISFVCSYRFRIKVKIERNLPKTCIAGRELRYNVQIENLGKKTHSAIYYREQSSKILPSFLEYSSFTEDGEEQRNLFDRKMGYYRWLSLIHINNTFQCIDQELPDLAAGKKIESTISLLPLKRGTIHLEGSTLSLVDPFGLCKRQVLCQSPANVLVLPKLYSVPKLYFPGSRKYHQGGITAAQNHGDSSEFISLREYTHGDPIKYIDWKATARVGKPIVKQHKDEYFSRYGLILDSYVARSYSQIFEEAVSVAASIMMNQDNSEAVLDLFFVGRKCITCSVGRGLTDQQRMLEILASVTTSQNRKFKEMTALVKHHSSLLSGVVLILIDLDEDRKELVDYLIAHKIPCKLIIMVDSNGKFTGKTDTLNVDFSFTEININRMEEDITLL
ncbi:DUF58 domain-containing protein [Desulforhopalus sp. IMCC35007]|uniref:DUF58 domain-containing protein n=1 Tax=Desulforhopalus sp. IMCC35007 TaxID=2569543 RepID=UPI0010AE4016|nr:DUF58 domain-containing protein [Desulforhopalus sp. IMCC35007]TKB09589.1 DUF58 domain-containing protein [Desulforhopalus sp. IMCC35007]